MVSMNEIVKVFEGKEIMFKMVDGEVYAKANSMCDSVKLDNWKRSANTKRYIEALKNKTSNNSVKITEFIISEEGVKGGSWIHEKLILNLARFISVDFELWCDDIIAELIREGKVELVKPSYMIDNPIERAKKWIEEQEEKKLIEEKAKQLQLEVKEKEEVIEVQKPKVEYYEKVLDSSASFTVTQIAKAFEMTAVSLNKVLQNQGIQFYQSGTWHLYSKYQGKGYEDIRTHILPNGDTRKSLVWTEKGMEFIGQVLESL